MLAATLEESDLEKLKYPLILMPKLDGIRCCILEGKAVTRKLKKIPNKYVRAKLEGIKSSCVLIDGELILENKTFNEIQSAIMSEYGEPNFIYKVFDCLVYWSFSPYKERLENIAFRVPKASFLEFLNYKLVYTVEELLEYENYCLLDKLEGIILRMPEASYKFGRSTLIEGGMMKFKRFQDSEATIMDSIALETNTNTSTLDNLGYTEHSDHQSGKIKCNMLGAWVVKDCNPESMFYGRTFQIGTGFTNEDRKEFWKNREYLSGKTITYKFQAHGSKDKPRTPVWIGFRKD